MTLTLDLLAQIFLSFFSLLIVKINFVSIELKKEYIVLSRENSWEKEK